MMTHRQLLTALVAKYLGPEYAKRVVLPSALRYLASEFFYTAQDPFSTESLCLRHALRCFEHWCISDEDPIPDEFKSLESELREYSVVTSMGDTGG